MTSDELYSLFRTDVVDNVQPYLWSDSEVYAYMNDAYYMFVRLTEGISDYTSPVTEIAATQGSKYGRIDPSIMRVRTATLMPDNDEIKVVNAQDLANLTDKDYGILRDLDSNTTEGKVRYLVIGMEPELVQFVNIPDKDYTVKLLVERMPTDVISGAGQTFDGVADHHHFHFLKWMRYHAYKKQDADTFDKARSVDEATEFYQYCDLAKREKDRARHKVRVVSYGGL